MKAIQITAQMSNDVAAELSEGVRNEQEVRLLQDLEMVLVGGGSDGAVVW